MSARFQDELAAKAVERLGPFRMVRGLLRDPRNALVGAAHTGDQMVKTGSREIGPLHELRPPQAHWLDDGKSPVTAKQAVAMLVSHAKVKGILAAARGCPLTENEIRRIVPLINPTRHVRNCFESSLALDGVLGGAARI